MANEQVAETDNEYSDSDFAVFLDGEPAGNFTKAGPLFEADVEIRSLQSGTSQVEASNAPGKVKFADVTLTQGMSSAPLFREWFNATVAPGGKTGSKAKACRRTVKIQQLDRDGEVLETYTYPGALIKKYSEGDFDAESNKFRMRMVVFHFRSAERTPGAG